jgi:hypothetical protein
MIVFFGKLGDGSQRGDQENLALMGKEQFDFEAAFVFLKRLK